MKREAIVLLAAVFCYWVIPSHAQVIDHKKTTEKKAEQKTNQNIDQTINKGLNDLESGVKGMFKKKDNKTDANKPKTDSAKNDQTKATDTLAKQQEPESLQTYSKFDFVPGEKVIFYDDFSSDNVGDFPAAWNTNGSAEVVTSNLFTGKWLKSSGRHSIWTDALLELPDNYTIEFDVIPIAGEESGPNGMEGYTIRLIQAKNAKAWDGGAIPGKAGFMFHVEYFGRPNYRTYINGPEGEGLGLTGHLENKEFFNKPNQKYHISIWVQKARIRLYQNENKLIDLPKAFPVASVKMDRLRIDEGASLVSNIRVAVGAPDMRSKLITEGKLVSYGILFDVNSAKLKPESYGSIKAIADVLKENPDVRVKIVGHTDSDGADASNLDLSKRRAASVKNELTKSFGIDAARMETDGKGEAEPVAENNSVTNKAKNRRVEFIKL
ncbi:MAG: OmpA family protein [Chitinophagaceae bacterium]|nr:OmpA family protein [Chitinophagaceae bacterium]